MAFRGFRSTSVDASTRRALWAIVILFASVFPLRAQTPTAGQNINMVSGTSWPGGDPFLQRQNEPSLAVSSRNSLHLLAGANDYRTVDLPVSDSVPSSLAGDAWLGVFKSYDGGLTWQSYLHPGYPQDNSAPASPLKAYSAAADPTVRAGAGGVFYYSGIAFNRGTNNGAVFVSTFFDTNVKENGSAPAGKDAIQHQNTVLVDAGTSGQFLDKTWIAVDKPRGTAMCTFNTFGGNTQTVPAGNVYVVWSRFTGSQSTKIMFSRSLDCGKTWSNPTKLSESSSINQGTNVAIDPIDGKVYVAWRQFATSSNPDSILVARSDDFGATFPSRNTSQVATITPFDQSTTGTRFRTNTLPSIAVSLDPLGKSYVHVVWAQRTGASLDGRIVMSTSSNAGKNWSGPTAIDAFGGAAASGHQFMPQITFSAGRLMVLYYDQRLDHTLALFKPTGSPFLGLYDRTQAPRGELFSPGGTTGSGLVFRSFIDDDPGVLPKRRHTIDLRVAEALPAGTPSFSSTLVSQYRMGLWTPDSGGVYNDDENQPISPQPPDKLYQLQVNVPNLPMFSLGTLPFLGDYIDIAGQNFVTDSAGHWNFNTSHENPPVFYATWTDNRDVVPPADSTGFVDWTRYTPPISSTNQGNGSSPSILDPTKTVPQCQPAYTGSRNQNIYMSRITEGLLVGSPQDAKPLSTTFQRAFVVTLQNQTKEARTFQLTISNQLPGGKASFSQGPVLSTLLDNVIIPGGSGAARPIFATSSFPGATFTVNVTETGANTIGLSGSVVFNPEGSVSSLAQPEGATADIGGAEIYTPSFQVWNSTNPNPFINISDPNAALQNISNQNISNADPAIQNISNQNISNQNISNQNISNQNISNPSPAVQNISNQNISNQNISNTTAANQNISNQNISNQNISNQNISNAPITDATYAVTNTGNTTHSYRVSLYGNNPYTTAPLQLIVTKNSATPTSVGCTLQSLPQSLAIARADNAPVAASLADASNPAIALGDSANATVAMAPGETLFLTLRGALTKDQMTLLTQQLTPVVTAHGANTDGISPDFALLLSIQTAGGALPGAVVGSSYIVTLQATGGKAPITWTLISGTLPAGLSLSTGGVISGTPSGTGNFTFTLQVADSTSPTAQKSTQTFTLAVSPRQTSAALSLSPASIAATAGSVATFTVTDTETTGAPSFPSGTVTVSGDGGVTGGVCTLAPSAVANQSRCAVTVTAPTSGADTITGSYAGSATHKAATATAPLTVTAVSTSTGISFSSGTVVVGQPVAVTVSVSATSPGVTASPTGTVSFSSSVQTDAFTPASNCSLVATGAGTAGCWVSVTASSASPHEITASYAGATGISSTSSSKLILNVNKRATSAAVSVSPNPLLAAQPGSILVTVNDTESSGTKSSPAGTVTLSSSAPGDAFTPSACPLTPGVAGVSTCTASVSGNSVGARTISAAYPGSGAHVSSGGSTSLTIRGNTATTITGDSPAPSGLGQAVTVTFTVVPAAPAVGTPTGTVTVSDGFGASCSATLPSGTCSLVPGSAGTVTLTATYPGDAYFLASSGTRQHSVLMPYTFTGFLIPLAAAGTLDAPTSSGTANYTQGVPVKWQLTDSAGNTVTDLASTQILQATYYAGGVCSAGRATGPMSVLYNPTTGAAGGSTFRTSGGTFIFNWSTQKLATGPGCYEVILQLNDGSAPKATQITLR